MVADSAEAAFRDCTIANSASYGLFAAGDVLCSLKKCIVEGNGYCGIVVAQAQHICRCLEHKLWIMSSGV